MKKRFLFHLLLAAFLLPAVSCSKDDLPDIDNATTLNMLDAENGKTYLGNSDIYINAANNFDTRDCLIAEIGTSKGLDKVYPPAVGKDLVNQAAVIPGHLYQAFRRDAVMQFSSGEYALNLSGDYYQFYVDSEIKKDEKRAGAVVRFTLVNPEAGKLPAPGTTIGTLTWVNDELTYDFPKGTEFAYDEDEMNDILTVISEGSNLRIKMKNEVRGNYAIYARNGKVYTTVYVKME